jgi:hypothetical protein
MKSDREMCFQLARLLREASDDLEDYDGPVVEAIPAVFIPLITAFMRDHGITVSTIKLGDLLRADLVTGPRNGPRN